MSLLDDLNAMLNNAGDAVKRSMYDPAPSLEVDGIVTETDIPAAELDYANPGEYAYPHSDYTSDPSEEAHIIDGENAFQPGGELPTDREELWRGERSTRDNPEWSVDAPADLLSTSQYQLQAPIAGTGALVPAKILVPNPFRVQVLIQNLSSTANANVNLSGLAGGVIGGIVIGPGQSITLPFNGEIWAASTLAATAVNVAVAEFVRKN